jgi:hypothetical protein
VKESIGSGDPAFKQTTAKMAIHAGKHGNICLKYHGGKITYHFDMKAKLFSKKRTSQYNSLVSLGKEYRAKLQMHKKRPSVK